VASPFVSFDAVYPYARGIRGIGLSIIIDPSFAKLYNSKCERVWVASVMIHIIASFGSVTPRRNHLTNSILFAMGSISFFDTIRICSSPLTRKKSTNRVCVFFFRLASLTLKTTVYASVASPSSRNKNEEAGRSSRIFV
jgi:hypothetical protein